MKKSGYRIRLEWFVPFDPNDFGGIATVNDHVTQATEFGQFTLTCRGGEMVNIQTKYYARREVPDAPEAAEPHEHAWFKLPDGRNACDCGIREQLSAPRLDIPAALKRT